MRLKVVSDYKFREKDAFLLLEKKRFHFTMKTCFQFILFGKIIPYTKKMFIVCCC